MDRRSILRLAGVGTGGVFGGCLGAAPPGGPTGLDGPHRFAIDAEAEHAASRLPLDLAYELDDAGIEPADPARMSWTVRNAGEEPLTLDSGPPWPFDVAFLLPDDEDAERVTMWTDAYEASDRVETSGREVRSWKEGFVTDRLEGGESITETYELAHDAPELAAGTYDFWRVVRARRDDAHDDYRFDFTVAIEPA